jgi:iron complex outermembrane recepter protein
MKCPNTNKIKEIINNRTAHMTIDKNLKHIHMKKINTYFIFLCLIFLLTIFKPYTSHAQNVIKPISEMTKEDVLKLSYDDLLAMPFEDLLKLSEIAGVSADELLKMSLNKNVTTASKKQETVFDSPLSTTVISKEEIELSGATCIEELFRLVPGMIVRQESNGNFDIHIRGNDNIPPDNFSYFATNTLTLVMIDGRIVYNYINGGTFWESLPISLVDIERIDIIRGPSSALYGANAVSGAINIITKQADNTNIKVNANVMGGSTNTKTADLSISKKFKKFGIRASGNYDNRDRFQNTFYCFKKEKYVVADSVVSVFGYPYYRDGSSFPDNDMAKDKYGANLFLNYDLNDKINFNLAGGTQNSHAQMIFFETLATPTSVRSTNTNYLDFKGKVYGFNTQVSYLFGKQDLCEGEYKPIIGYDLSTLNANLDYEYNFRDLTIRPGFSYQSCTYDDSKRVKELQVEDPTRQGLLNGKKEINSLALNLRVDYLLFDKLRFIAAVRGDKYNVPDDYYYSYQFVSSYKISDDHIIRAVYSKANRSAFIGNSYADFQNPLGNQGIVGTQNVQVAPGVYVPFRVQANNYYQYYVGNKDLKLANQNMFELGIRNKITKKIQTDFEFFYSITKDFDALFGSKSKFTVVDSINPVTRTIHVTLHDSLVYKNLAIESKQFGFTGSINVTVSNNLLLKLYGTIQRSDLSKYAPLPDKKPDSLISKENSWTPTYYGGMSITYQPFKKIIVYSDLYTYGGQTYSRYVSPFGENGTTHIDTKYIVNAKISYKFWKDNSVFINVRNLFGDNKKEFAFSDDVGSLYLVGLHLSF